MPNNVHAHTYTWSPLRICLRLAFSPLRGLPAPSATYHSIPLLTSGVRPQTAIPCPSSSAQPYKDSSLGACMMGFLMVLFWVIFSFFILIG